MSADKFDQMLREGLRKHTEPIPPDFTDSVLKQALKEQDRKILKQVILQERLALAGCIILAIGIIIMMALLANANGNIAAQIQNVLDKAIQVFYYNWQLNLFTIALLGFTIYAIVDFLVSDT